MGGSVVDDILSPEADRWLHAVVWVFDNSISITLFNHGSDLMPVRDVDLPSSCTHVCLAKKPVFEIRCNLCRPSGPIGCKSYRPEGEPVGPKCTLVLTHIYVFYTIVNVKGVWGLAPSIEEKMKLNQLKPPFHGPKAAGASGPTAWKVAGPTSNLSVLRRRTGGNFEHWFYENIEIWGPCFMKINQNFDPVLWKFRAIKTLFTRAWRIPLYMSPPPGHDYWLILK